MYFAEYLRPVTFLVRTDHHSLQWLWRSTNPRVIRWRLTLAEYSFSIIYQRGTAHAHVDIFTRDEQLTEMDQLILQRLEPCVHVLPILADVESSPVSNFTQRDLVDSPFPSPKEFAIAQEKERQDHPEHFQILSKEENLWMTKTGRIYVPDSLRSCLLFYFHFGRTGGHQGINRTQGRMNRMFWWPNLRADIASYVGQCLACTRRAIPPRMQLTGHLTAAYPNRVVGIDIIGPIGHQERRYYALTMIDHHTKFAEAVLFETDTGEISAEAAWQAFFIRWASVFGCPSVLISDNATCFTGRNFIEAATDLGIKKVLITPYHPQANGVIEAFHQFFVRGLSTMMRQVTWGIHEITASVLFAYRATPHPSTGFAPYFLLTGMDMSTPFRQEWADLTTPRPYSTRLQGLATARHLTAERLARAAVHRQEKESPRSRSPLPVKIGDLVIYRFSPHDIRATAATEAKRAKKTVPRWSEPFRVLKFTDERGQVAVIQSLWDEGVRREVHAADLLLIPKVLDENITVMTQREILTELRCNPSSDASAQLQRHIQQIPAVLRPMAKRRLRALAASGMGSNKIPLPDTQTSSSARTVSSPRKRQRAEPALTDVPSFIWDEEETKMDDV